MREELIAEWKRRLARPASVGKYVAVAADPFASSFGHIAVQAPGEKWPEFNGKLMCPLLQINCGELPHRPESISDLAMIRVWIGEEFEPEPSESGRSWCVRASRSLNELRAVPEPQHGGDIQRAGIEWLKLEADYPTWDDAPIDVFPQELCKDYYDIFQCADGIKVGGWPRNVQSEIFWAPGNQHPASPEYVFQIDSAPDLNWEWGDMGVGYFGRGTGSHRDRWAFEWQCY